MRSEATALVALALLTASLNAAAESVPAGPLRYKVLASKPRLNRLVTGDVTRYVNGVAAEPVDSFVYDGVGSVEIDGHLTLVVDPVAEVGFVSAEWSDENGEWTYWQQQFVHPEHLSGVRIGRSVSHVDFFINEGITDNVYLHGNTGAGMPVLPTLFAYLAAWGPAVVTRNGQLFVNPFEIPSPQWLGHLMVTEGVRLPDGSVRTLSGAIYDPSQADRGAVEVGDIEMHLVFHDERFPLTENVPALFSFFYHLVFEDVAIEIVQADEPIPLEPPEQFGGTVTPPAPPLARSRDRTTNR